MAVPKFIVCESASQWTVAMRWGFSDGKFEVQQTPSLASCLAMLEDAAGSVVAIEVAMFGVEATLRTIRDIREKYPSNFVIALTDSENAHEALLREAGAAHVVASRREVRAAVRLVQRCLASSEARPASYRDDVWNRMPWQNLNSPAPSVD
jgi:DNA-binding NarL/FixJ family response regulator